MYKVRNYNNDIKTITFDDESNAVTVTTNDHAITANYGRVVLFGKIRYFYMHRNKMLIDDYDYKNRLIVRAYPYDKQIHIRYDDNKNLMEISGRSRKIKQYQNEIRY